MTSSSSEFFVDNSTLTLGASGNKSVGVTFKPTSVGSKSATITLTLAKLTANGITVDKKEITINVSGTGTQTYTFAANAIPNRQSYGSASATVDASIVSSNTSESKTARFTATPNTGYDFIGWATSASATSSTITDNPLDETLEATEAYPNQSKTLYAIFKPYFKFSATAESSNTTLGTATGSVTNKIQGDVDATSMSTTATFTATPTDDDCLFLGWYTSNSYSGNPVSTNNPYSISLTNNTVGTTESKKLYALFKKKHNLQWADTDMDLNLVLGTTGLSSAATVTSNKTITYTSGNTDALTIDANGAITTVGLGSSTVTASVAGDDIYRAESISRTFNVGEKKQATFTPAWGESTSTDIKVGTTTTIGLTNIATDATFTISATPAGIISWSRSGNTLTISGDVAGTATLSLTQIGNTYLYGNTANYTINVSKYANTLALAEETKTMEVERVWTNVITNVGNGNTQVTCSPTGIATYTTANGGTITANAEGSTTFTFTQAATADHEGITKTLNLTVTKVANTLSISLPAQEVEVDGAIELDIDANSPATIAASITNTQLSSTENNGTDVITYADGVITAHNAGMARITFSQPATAKYAASQSYVFDITVSKVHNSIAVQLNGTQKNSLNVARGDQIALAYSSPSNGAYHVSLTSGSATTATLTGNTITAGTTDGVNVWTITQDETYKYEAATATVRIKVNSIAEDPGSVYTGWLNDEKSWDTIDGTGALELDGPGEFITFDAKRTTIWGVSNTKNFYAQYSTDGGSSWENVITINLENTDTWYPQSNPKDPLPENTTHVRILTEMGATGSKQVRNVIVTRKTFVRANADQGTNLGTTYVDATPYLTKKFTVSYSTTNGGSIEIISSNPRFEVTPSVITVTPNSDNVGDDATPVEITVTYKPNKQGYEYAGADAATITVSDLFNSAELTFTATANKRSTTIARGSNTETTTTVDGVIDNVFAYTGTSTTYPSANSNDDFYYVISHTPSAINNGNGVISYDPATNTVTGLNGGTATLTIYQKNTAIYNATSQAFNFTVNKLANTTNIALSGTTMNVDGSINIELTNDNSKGDVTATFSNITYANSGQNREGGLLSYTAATKTLTGVNAGTCTVTVTQAETYKYLSKSVTFNGITVNKLVQTLTWDNPDLETGLQRGSTLSGNTATSNVGLTPVTYSSGNTTSITVDPNTGVLTAVEVGSNIAITASQAGNYKYLPATLIRQFSVFNKQVPTFATDAHFTGLSGRIEQTCTATITVTGVSSGDDFTITNGDNTIINAVRDGETITITGLAIGNTTLTLAQAGNDDYIAKTHTYNIEVYWPDDFLALSPTVSPSYTEGTYRKVFLNRTLKAGYSTIALPFDTSVEEIVGSGYDEDLDWVAQLQTVTYSQADGYTLYFDIVDDGIITANQPYVLHLQTAVATPSWTNVDVEEALAASPIHPQTGYSGYSGWSMASNYTVNFPMDGKYGVVNTQGGLMLGSGENAKLNAFSAYITAPSGSNNAPRLRVAYVAPDGKATVVEGLSFDNDNDILPVAIYGPDGRRRSQMQRGLNIVRQCDGSVRKVQR